MEFGIVGLVKMGDGLARQAVEKGLRVAGYDKRPDPELKQAVGEVNPLRPAA